MRQTYLLRGFFNAVFCTAAIICVPGTIQAGGDLYYQPLPPDPTTVSYLYPGTISFIATTTGAIGSYKLWFFQRDEVSTKPAMVSCRVYFNIFGDSRITQSGNIYYPNNLSNSFVGEIPPYASTTYRWGEVNGVLDDTNLCYFHPGDRVEIGITPFADPYWLGDGITGIVTSKNFPLYESTTTETGNIYHHVVAQHFPRASTTQETLYDTGGEFFFNNSFGTSTITSVSEFLIWNGSRNIGQAPTELTPTVYQYVNGNPIQLCTGTPIDVSDPSKVFQYHSFAPDSISGYKITKDHFEDGFYYGTVHYAIPNCVIPPATGDTLISIALRPSAGGYGWQLGTLRDPSLLDPQVSIVDQRFNVEASVNGVLVATSTPPLTKSSNVLFLPGIEGSRLYGLRASGSEDQFWEPNIDADVKDLFMSSDGSSVRGDIYAKEGDILNELPNGRNIYKSFIIKMNGLKSAGIITDWKPIAYDWRLSLDDLLTYGHKVGNRIYYSGNVRATSSPYIIQELKQLAATSKTGKVTIIAHSNGGLLAKRLTQVLGPMLASQLIDKIIFVAVPQVGTPMALAAGLHGFDQDHLGGFVTSKNTARTFASTSPMFYNLLPSANYFTYVDDPMITFDSSLSDWISKFGNIIHSGVREHTFLTDSYGRVDAQTGDINQPIQLHSILLTKAESLHSDLDRWTPPPGVQLIQIAGWGVPATVKGINYKKSKSGVAPDPVFTVDGDGTVVVPSALWTSTSTGVINYWLNLRGYNKDHSSLFGLKAGRFIHDNLFETTIVLGFISDTIINLTKDLSSYVYLTKENPVSDDVRLKYALHSPLSLNLYDNQGHHTGISTTTGEIEEQIPGTYYSELGESKYIFSDADTPARLILNGYATGTFTLNVDQYVGDTRTASTSFQDIPTTASTTVTMDIVSDIATLSTLSIDKNSDGVTDAAIHPIPNGVASIYRFDGFLQPINDPTNQPGQNLSVFKAGSTIPVKFQLKRADGTIIQASSVLQWIVPQKGATMSSPIGESVYFNTGSTGSVYKWDADSQQYLYNWSTKGFTAGYWYKLSVELDHGEIYTVTIGLK